MSYLLVRHKVEDYSKWKKVFDEDAANRKAAGSLGIRVLRNVDDPNEIVAIGEWPDLEKSRAFASSPELREAMERAGVTDAPDILFLDETDSQPA